MAREWTLKCDICSKPIAQASGKVFIVPVTPGNATYYMSQYSHSGDLCADCVQDLQGKLAKRKRRSPNGTRKKQPKRKTRT